MTLPAVVGIASVMLFGIVDTFFIGMLGTEPLAAIGFILPVTFVVMNFTMGLTIGLMSVLAKTLGKGDHHLAARITTDSLLLAIILVAIVSMAGLSTIDALFILLGATGQVLEYVHQYMTLWYVGMLFLIVPMVGNGAIRATGDMKTPSVIMIIAGGLNAILDPLLIFGVGPFPEMGMRGAALATVISWVVTFVAAIWILRTRVGLIVFSVPPLPVLLQSWRPVLYIGLPAAVTNMLIPVATAVLTAIVASHGAEAVAAFGVGSRIEILAMVVVMALSTSLAPFVGQNYGAGQGARIRQAVRLSFRFTLWFQFLVYFCLFLLSGLIADIFSNDQGVIELIVLFLMIVPLSYAFQGIQMLIGSLLNALNYPFDAMLLSVIRLFGLYLPISMLGSYWYGLDGIFWGMAISNLFAVGVAFLWMRARLRSILVRVEY